VSFVLQLVTLLQTGLNAIGCPASVVSAEDHKRVAWAEHRVVVDLDTDTPDTFDAPSLSENPKQRLTHNIPIKLTLYTKSGRPGATLLEHRHRSMLFVHAVICELERIVKTAEDATPPGLGGFPWVPPTNGKHVIPEDLKATDRPGGDVYELKWALPVAIPKRQSWTVEIYPTATLAGVDSMTKVHRGLADDDNNPLTVPAGAETACGA
jgi:hypothetical protein